MLSRCAAAIGSKPWQTPCILWFCTFLSLLFAQCVQMFALWLIRQSPECRSGPDLLFFSVLFFCITDSLQLQTYLLEICFFPLTYIIGRARCGPVVRLCLDAMLQTEPISAPSTCFVPLFYIQPHLAQRALSKWLFFYSRICIHHYTVWPLCILERDYVTAIVNCYLLLHFFYFLLLCPDVAFSHTLFLCI